MDDGDAIGDIHHTVRIGIAAEEERGGPCADLQIEVLKERRKGSSDPIDQEIRDRLAAAHEIVDECDLTHLHVFPFSPRTGTPAARMPQHGRALIKERAARLRAKGDEARRGSYRREIGNIRSVLVEKPGMGRTEHFAPVEMTGGTAGEIVPMRITAAMADKLMAEPT